MNSSNSFNFGINGSLNANKDNVFEILDLLSDEIENISSYLSKINCCISMLASNCVVYGSDISNAFEAPNDLLNYLSEKTIKIIWPLFLDAKHILKEMVNSNE